jgi:exosortase A-associated hydrolase 2
LRTTPLQAFFLEAQPGYRFCLFHPCSGTPAGSVLFVHAFAEEMNKSRRMAALQARALAAAGFDVLQIDLLGCGDSSGDFADATWDAWLADVQRGAQALAARSSGPLWLWGHRTGCLLASSYARRSAQPARLLLWHPVPAGASFLNQFLRMKLIAQAGTGARSDTSSLRAALYAGQSVEVAGYMLSPRLAAGLEAATLEAPPPGSAVCWLDVVHAAGAAPPAASQRIAQEWSQQGLAVAHQTVNGVAFWQTQEINECEALIAQSIRSMTR